MLKYLQILICVGFFITIHNNTDRQLNCFLYWVDHPYQFNRPADLFGGEMDAGETFNISSERVPGTYLTHWVDRHSDWENSQLFIVRDDKGRITITPNEVNQE